MRSLIPYGAASKNMLFCNKLEFGPVFSTILPPFGWHVFPKGDPRGKAVDLPGRYPLPFVEENLSYVFCPVGFEGNLLLLDILLFVPGDSIRKWRSCSF